MLLKNERLSGHRDGGLAEDDRILAFHSNTILARILKRKMNPSRRMIAAIRKLGLRMTISFFTSLFSVGNTESS